MRGPIILKTQVDLSVLTKSKHRPGRSAAWAVLILQYQLEQKPTASSALYLITKPPTCQTGLRCS